MQPRVGSFGRVTVERDSPIRPEDDGDSAGQKVVNASPCIRPRLAVKAEEARGLLLDAEPSVKAEQEERAVRREVGLQEAAHELIRLQVEVGEDRAVPPLILEVQSGE